MEFTKHQGFIKMMADLAFEPQLETVASKVSHGLSPLYFFDLERGALLSAMYYYNLNQEASVNTSFHDRQKQTHIVYPSIHL